MRFLLRVLRAVLSGARVVPVRLPGDRAAVLHWSGLVVPVLRGGAPDEDDNDGDGDGDGAEAEAEDSDTDDGDGDEGNDGDEDQEGSDPEAGLSDEVKAILKKERDARRAAERKAKRLAREAREKDKPREDPKKDEGSPVDAITLKIRKANLKAALADEGITGKHAKAAMRLLEGLSFDEDDEPENLADALEDAEETYGTQVVRGTPQEGDGTSPRRAAPRINGGSGKGGGKGPRLTAEELNAAKQAGMSPERYEAFKNVSNLKDYEELQRKLAAAQQS